MSKDLNQCNFIGRLGKDVDVRFMPSGSAIANFSIACGDDYKDKQTGQKVEQTNWINITAFGRLAEICGDYLKKGSQVYISGKQITEKYQDKQGNDRYTTKIIASDMQMLGGGGDNRNDPAQHASGNRNQPNPTYQQADQQQPADDSFDDDLPF